VRILTTDMVDAFLDIQDEILEIASQYRDTDIDIAAKSKQLEMLAS